MLCNVLACAAPVTQTTNDASSTPILHQDYFVASDQYQLPFLKTNALSEPDAVVIALHGFNDYSQAFVGLCGYLIDKNIACYAYDQRGFGRTQQRGIWPAEGKLALDLAELVSLIKENFPDKAIYVAGESMGGAVAISALAHNTLHIRDHIAGAALFAPAVWGRSTQPWYQRWGLAMAVQFAPSWKPTGESLGVVATDNTEALRAMGRDPLVIKETRIDTIYGLTNLMDEALASAPLTKTAMLIMYGEHDEVIPVEPTCQMLQSLAESKSDFNLQVYPNGYHMLTRDLQAQKVFEDFYTWMLSQASAPLTQSSDALCSAHSG